MDDFDFDEGDDNDEDDYEFDFGAVLDEELLEEFKSQDYLNPRRNYEEMPPRIYTWPSINSNWVIPAILIFIIFLTILLFASR